MFGVSTKTKNETGAGTTAEHTPEPWKVVGSEVWGPRRRITMGKGAYDEKDRAIRNANARLIAAAPDLLKALKRLNNAVGSGFPSDSKLIEELRSDASRAIAKAEGRAE